jgi:purine-binding chemotaxis protein CheW
MSVVVEVGGELYSLLADQVGEVLSPDPAERSANPATLDENWRAFSRGVHRLGENLLILVDVERLMAINA